MEPQHTTFNYILNPEHPITISIIGAGGTGGQVLNRLARMHVALMSLGHPGFHVRMFDEDIVEHSNLARQLFSVHDIGHSKAIALIARINRFYGTSWLGQHQYLTKDNRASLLNSNIIISCTDSISSRKLISTAINSHIKFNGLRSRKPYYWMDFGNGKNIAQMVIGTVRSKERYLPTIDKLFPEYLEQEEDKTGPSCSLAESLNNQDLFINSMIAELGCNLLWKMFRNTFINVHGFFLNLSDYSIAPIKIKSKDEYFRLQTIDSGTGWRKSSTQSNRRQH